jgi:1-deoxyxylulose-5-phosphate synthase
VVESLKRLRTDYIDLYQVHVIDHDTTREETLAILDDLVREGTVRAIGEAATLGTPAHLVASDQLARTKGLARSVSMQAHYNLLVRDARIDLIPELRKRDMNLLPYMPLANGLLTGKYLRAGEHPAGSRLDRVPEFREYYADEHWATLETVRGVAEELEMTMVELAMAWLLSEPCVTSVIAGATRPGQIKENAGAAGKRLTADARALVERVLADRRGGNDPPG